MRLKLEELVSKSIFVQTIKLSKSAVLNSVIQEGERLNNFESGPISKIADGLQLTSMN